MVCTDHIYILCGIKDCEVILELNEQHRTCVCSSNRVVKNLNKYSDSGKDGIKIHEQLIVLLE